MSAVVLTDRIAMYLQMSRLLIIQIMRLMNKAQNHDWLFELVIKGKISSVFNKHFVCLDTYTNQFKLLILHRTPYSTEKTQEKQLYSIRKGQGMCERHYLRLTLNRH